MTPLLSFTRAHIANQLRLGFGLMVLLVAGLVATVALRLQAGNAELATLARQMAQYEAASELLGLVRDNGIASMTLLVPGRAEHLGRLIEQIDQRNAQVEQSLQRMGAALTAPAEAELLAQMASRLEVYVAGVRHVMKLVKDDRQAEAALVADVEMVPMLTPFLKAVEALRTSLQTTWTETSMRSAAAADRTLWLTLALGAIAVLTGIAIALAITRSIGRGLGGALGFAKRVAGGDLSERGTPEGHNEFAQLMRALDDMRARLARVVGDIRTASDQVAARSTQIADASSELAQRTSLQSEDLRGTTAAIAQLNGTAQQTAASSQAVTQLASASADEAQRGGAVMGQVVVTMDEMNTASHRIADITSVIDGIAFQTNILALNAAVEAARAGEHGRGFAVVAAEVRALAQRCAQAAREIKTLTGDSVEKSEFGADLVREAGERMSGLVQSVRRVTTMVGEIAAATSEQTSSIGALSSALARIDSATQRSGTMVEESAAAADSLKSDAQHLAHIVGAFRLGQ